MTGIMAKFLLFLTFLPNFHSKLILNNFDYSDGFLTNTKIPEENNRQFKIQLEPNVTYELVLNPKQSMLTNAFTEIFIYEKIRKFKLNLKDFDLVNGFVSSHPEFSSVEGQLSEGCFYGIVTVFEKQYRIEKLKNFPEIFDLHENESKNALVTVSYLGKNVRKRSYKTFIGNGKLCSLFVLIDNSFLKITHNNNIKSAISQVVITLEATDSLFRSTDFDQDGQPDNVGFIIKILAVIESEYSPMNLLPKFTTAPRDSVTYLNSLARYLVLNEVCLGIAFTAQSFKDSIIGISYAAEPEDGRLFKITAGGICDRTIKQGSLMNLNALVVSSRHEKGHVISQAGLELSLAHELGHSFGSDHDSTPECSGYIMASHAPKRITLDRFQFSSCSKRSITKTILSKGHCLESATEPFCGNGRIENGEVCDCGTKRYCDSYDPCCIPGGDGNSCQVNPKYECHPSQGLCCTSKCTLNRLPHLDCTKFINTCSYCKNNDNCSCGLDGRCINGTCHSGECIRINLTECECPFDCKTCCNYDEKCLPSQDITQILIQKGHISVQNLLLGRNKPVSFDLKRGNLYKFCDLQNCTELFFNEVKSSEYCLSMGLIGICSQSNKCLVPVRKQIYPDIKLRTAKDRSFVKKIENYVLLIVVVINVFNA